MTRSFQPPMLARLRPGFLCGLGARQTLALVNRLLRKVTTATEPDARLFSQEEWGRLLEAGSQPWQAHFERGAVRRISPEEARATDPERIRRLPLRCVRASNRAEAGSMIAKSRSMVPGHVATSDHVRTDAPVTPQHVPFGVERGCQRGIAHGKARRQ